MADYCVDMSKRTSSNQKVYLAYIASHPGCSIADVNRACKHNPRAGHKWIYDSVGRLIRRGFVACSKTSGVTALEVIS
jgi:hypothetical protein